MEEKFIQYLQEKFGPVKSIILHGSRAKGKARDHSDWDFVVLVDHDIKQTLFRHTIDGQEMDFEVFKLPIKENEIMDKLDTKLSGAKVIFDTNNEGQYLIDATHKIIEAGIPETYLTQDELDSGKHFFQSAIRGMEDNLDNPAMFLKKLSFVYPRIVNKWFHLKKKSYSKNLYDALPRIQKEDAEFYSYLEKVFSFESSPTGRIEGAKQATKHIYGE